MAKRSKEQWRVLIGEHRDSGLSAAEYCRRRGINPKYFSVRKRQLSEKAFVPVKPVRSESASVPDIRLRLLEVTVPVGQLSSVLAQTGFADELL